MSDLSHFTDEEIELLCKAMYQAGAFVSHADDEGGEDDDEREIRALNACIHSVAKKYNGPGLVDDIARRTIANDHKWEVWIANSFKAPDTCKQAVSLIKAKASEDDLKNYRAAVMEAAQSVAMAYGEFSSFDDEEEADEGFFSKLASKVTSSFSNLSPDDSKHPMNISASEGSAINAIRQALKS